ncbi:hypothetical protein [Cohnella hongkongensis]|uniref:Uncharacterized protein n=1 Tax=Cohnella hongkongensis TaxID=178337 RepID=A0ABV9F895_9BACL
MQLETGIALPKPDRVELSEASRRLAAGISERQLPEGVVKHNYSVRPVFTAEIEASLSRALSGKPPEVTDAVHFLIARNFVPDGSVADEEERAALLESGLSQAKFIADRYLTGDEAAEFLAAMKKIAAYAQTRTVDPESGQARYIELPHKPVGAPDDYIDLNRMMKKYDPEAYRRLTDILQNGSGVGFSSLLMEFQRKMAQNPEWVREYRAEVHRVNTVLTRTTIDNRFEGADTSDLASFLQDMNGKFDNTSFANKDFLTRNLESFSLILRKLV